MKMKPYRILPTRRNPLPLPLRAKLVRSRESSSRTAKSPAPRNVCGVTENHRPVMKLLELIHILALPTKRRRRTVSKWRNQNSVWKKAAKS
ncbi:hypothetical protein [Oscillibacter sp.]|uniref:hypothetical protein n=1 Tax=Oscillibacter sp. TaxID=1945593 RepID=UPI0028991445|nr:hypothetical protein [Oscillibacter sp.]